MSTFSFENIDFRFLILQWKFIFGQHSVGIDTVFATMAYLLAQFSMVLVKPKVQPAMRAFFIAPEKGVWRYAKGFLIFPCCNFFAIFCVQ